MPNWADSQPLLGGLKWGLACSVWFTSVPPNGPILCSGKCSRVDTQAGRPLISKEKRAVLAERRVESERKAH